MEKLNGKHFTGPMAESEEDDFLGNLDYEKIFLVFKKSLPWIICIVIFTNVFAFLYIRYTKPLFQSHSDLKLDIKNEASLFGLNTPMEGATNLTNLSGEIELIKSRLFYTKVIKVLDLDVNYYAYGSIINEERYKNAPFKVDYSLENEALYDKPIDIEIINQEEYKLTCITCVPQLDSVYQFGQPVITTGLDFMLTLIVPFTPELKSNNYYFTINSERTVMDYLDGNLNVQPLNLSANTLRISFTDHNRYKARDLVNAIDTIYLNYTQEEKNKAIKQKIVFLDEQLSSTERQLDKFETYFENFTINNKTTNLQSDISKTIVVMEEIDSQRFELNMRLTEINHLYDQIIKDSLQLRTPSDNKSLPGQLKTTLELLVEQQRKREILLSSYSENTYAFQKRNQEFILVKKSAVELIENYKADIAAKLQSLQKKKQDLEKNFVGLPSKSTEFSKSKRFYSLYEEFYLSLIQKKNEFEIARAGTVTDFVILSSATLPSAAIFPIKSYVYGAGAVSGIILSLLLLLILYVLHDKVSSQNELERLTPAPLLGVIPQYKKEKMPYTRLVVDKNSKSALGEAFRSIRTNMEFIRAHHTKRIISVTSTISGEGKTFISVNLGGIISLSNQKVVIVDLDMRKPKVHLAFSEDVKSFKGVSTILINKHNIEECILPTSIPNLHYIPAGPTPPNPSELIMSELFDNMLENLKGIYDIIILDTPPIGMVTDGILAMKKADLAIYVVRAGYSKKLFIKTLNRLIQVNKFNNISVLLNSLETTKNQGYGYGYDHGYYDNTPNISRLAELRKTIFKGK